MCILAHGFYDFIKNNKLHAMNNTEWESDESKKSNLNRIAWSTRKVLVGSVSVCACVCVCVRVSVAISFVKLKRVSVPFHFYFLWAEWMSVCTDSQTPRFLIQLVDNTCVCLFVSKKQRIGEFWLRTKPRCLHEYGRVLLMLPPFLSPARFCLDSFTLM